VLPQLHEPSAWRLRSGPIRGTFGNIQGIFIRKEFSGNSPQGTLIREHLSGNINQGTPLREHPGNIHAPQEKLLGESSSRNIHGTFRKN
jgi:hypothetical protein